MFWLYTIFYYLGAGLTFPFEALKRSSDLRKTWILQRLGIYKKPQWAQKRKTLWIHAVSVGEVIAVSKLVNRLSENFNIVLTTITDTGQRVAQEKIISREVNFYFLPFDCPFAIKRAIRAFSPSALIIAETELWPNLIRTASRRIPVLLINARLSEKSFKRYLKIKFFIKKMLENICVIGVQEEIYKERFKKLGVPEDKIIITGNTKFDIEIKKVEFDWENVIPRPVVIAGSTHFPEEELITRAFLSLKKAGTLILVPRHPQRFEEVEKVVQKLIASSRRFEDVTFYRLSKMENIFKNLKFSRRVIIMVDKMGVLGALYRICDVAVIGGSFIPHGGQNPLEAIYWKKPVIFGRSMENFPFIEEFIKEKACFQVDKEELAETLKKLLENEQLRKETGKRAYFVFKKRSGATEKTLTLIKKFI